MKTIDIYEAERQAAFGDTSDPELLAARERAARNHPRLSPEVEAELERQKLLNQRRSRNAARVTSELLPGVYQPPVGLPCWSVADAAAELEVSEGTVRRHMRNRGVARIAGRGVAGLVRFVRWTGGQPTQCEGFVPYNRDGLGRMA